MKLFRFAFLALITAVLLSVGYSFCHPPSTSIPQPVQTTLSLLRQIPQQYLITSRQEFLNVNVVDEGGWLLGPREGMSCIRITTYCGVDLHQLTPGDIRMTDRLIVIKLPEPSLLSVDADLGSYGFVTKSSGLQHIRDALRGHPVHNELFEKTKAAIDSYRSSGYPEAREEIVTRLNRNIHELFLPVGLEVRFE